MRRTIPLLVGLFCAAALAAHNASPYLGRWTDRLDRALAVVSHSEPLHGRGTDAS